MTSAALTTLGFGVWYPLNLSAKKALLAALPFRPGVYAIRCCNSQRVLDGSDLFYFGKATNLNGLNRRIRQYFHPGHGNATSLRIRSEIVGCCDFEVSWTDGPPNKARALESYLIESYEHEHGRLPPWNKQR